MKVVVIGGVAGGMSAAARLRRLDESADIVVLERDDYVSFANCGLPYHIGGDIEDREALLLQTPESLRESLALDVRTGHEALDVDRASRTVTVRDTAADREYVEPYDRLVLATGASPLRPPLPGVDHPRIRTLRSIPDMDAIIDILDAGARSRRRHRRRVHRPGDGRGAAAPRARGDPCRGARPGDDGLGPRDVPPPRRTTSPTTAFACCSSTRAAGFADADGRVVVDLGSEETHHRPRRCSPSASAPRAISRERAGLALVRTRRGRRRPPHAHVRPARLRASATQSRSPTP